MFDKLKNFIPLILGLSASFPFAWNDNQSITIIILTFTAICYIADAFVNYKKEGKVDISNIVTLIKDIIPKVDTPKNASDKVNVGVSEMLKGFNELFGNVVDKAKPDDNANK